MKYNSKVVIAFFNSHHLVDPVQEFRFLKDRKFRFDWAWPDYKVALEVEGGLFTFGAHARGKGILRDMEKGNLAVLAGWRVLRVQPKDLCTLETVNMIKEAMR